MRPPGTTAEANAVLEAAILAVLPVPVGLIDEAAVVGYLMVRETASLETGHEAGAVRPTVLPRPQGPREAVPSAAQGRVHPRETIREAAEVPRLARLGETDRASLVGRPGLQVGPVRVARPSEVRAPAVIGVA